MTLPNFLILGAAKAGTTAIYYYLGQHPQVYVSALKETNFFALEGEPAHFTGPGDDKWINSFSITSPDAYKNLFSDVADETAVGEASPLYLYSARAVERIRHHIPNAKLIVILRNPIERAFSAFLHMYRIGREPLADFGQALRAEEERMAAGWEWFWQYKLVGLYHNQVRRYCDTFPNQVRVFLYEDLNLNPLVTIQDMFQFLGVSTSFVPDLSRRHNANDLPLDKIPVFTPQVRAELRTYFREDILRLQELIGRDLSHWLVGGGAASTSAVNRTSERLGHLPVSRHHPQVARVDADDVLSPLKGDLLDLRSAASDVRLQAFERIRKVPKALLSSGYERFRRVTPSPGWELDCLERLEVEPPDPPIVCDRCICTVVSPGYEAMLAAMLDTLALCGRSPEARVVVFAVDESFDALARRGDITRVRCRSVEPLSSAVKGVIYSAPRFVQARQFLSLEADMLVVGGLQPLWDALDGAQPTLALGVRSPGRKNIMEMLVGPGSLGGRTTDMAFLTDLTSFDCPYWFNGGVLGGGREAFLRLDEQLRRLAPQGLLWMEGGSARHFTEEFLMNLGVGLLDCAAELDSSFNIQFRSPNREHWVQTERSSEGLRFRHQGGAARILHFLSPQRRLQWEIKAEIDQFGIAPS